MQTTIKIKQTSEMEIAVNFPMYVKSEHDIFKYAILSKEKVISVSDGRIRKSYIDVALNDKFTIISEKEFCDYLVKTRDEMYDFSEGVLDMIESSKIDSFDLNDDPAHEEYLNEQRQSY